MVRPQQLIPGPAHAISTLLPDADLRWSADGTTSIVGTVLRVAAVGVRKYHRRLNLAGSHLGADLLAVIQSPSRVSATATGLRCLVLRRR